MRVIKDNILIEEPIKAEKKSEGGIILQTEDNYSLVVESKVLSIGEEVTQVAVGDTIVHRAKAGASFKNEGVSYRVLTVNDVIAVL